MLQVASIHDIVRIKPVLKFTIKEKFSYVRRKTLLSSNINSVDFERKSVVLRNYEDINLYIPEFCVADLLNATVLPDGAIIYEDFIVKETISASVFGKKSKHFALRPLSGGGWGFDNSRVEKASFEDAVCVARYGIEYYGHWLAEILPRFVAAKEYIGGECPLLMPPRYMEFSSSENNIWQTIRRSAELVGIDTERFVPIPEAGLVVPRLRYVSPMGSWGSMSPLIQDVFDSMAFGLQGDQSGARIYVSRGDAPDRRVTNELEVIALLRSYGFSAVQSGMLSFQEQIKVFSSAEVVCGPLGSALTNIVFSPRGADVLPLIPAKWDDIFFYDLAAQREQNWCELRCEVPNEDHKLYYRNDIVVDLNLLEHNLLRYKM